MNLELFSNKLQHYCRLTANSRKTLAYELGMHPSVLSHKLKGTDNRTLTHAEVKAIIKILAKWEAISSQEEALELMALINCPSFTTQEWQTLPLNLLERSKPAQPTITTSMGNHPENASPEVRATATSKTSPVDSPKNNLPGQLSSFIGRGREKWEVKRALFTSRLLTLTGTGGVGKTRLSLEIAAEVLDRFADGVWFVELAPLSDPALIAQTIATIIGLSEQPGRPILTTMDDYLRSRCVLLVLDNCEHLVEECVRVIDTLIRNCSKLHILSTSRESLGITGEVTYLVPTLSLPESDENIAPEEVGDYEALQLFVERAKTTSPELKLEASKIADLVWICQRLDGIPLALELAAARTRLLTLEQIKTRLNDRFHLLTRGNRAALPRQQTLKATVDWSYNLLSEDEKWLLSRSSTFVGGWDLAAAERICGGAGLEEAEILDGLASLTNKSLLVVDKQGEEARYFFLETIQQYGLEKLKERGNGEEEAVRRRHLSYYADMAEELGLKMMHQAQSTPLKRLDRERDNIRAALDYGLRIEQVERVVQLTSGLYLYWEIRGFQSEGQYYLEQVLALDGNRGVSRGITLGWAGFMAVQQGNLQTARTYFEEALTLAKQTGDQKLLWHAYTDLGIMGIQQGNYAEARLNFEETLPLAEEVPTLTGYKPVSRGNLGYTLMELGEYNEAGRLFGEELALAQELGNGWMTTWALINLAKLASMREDYLLVHHYLKEALKVSEEINYLTGKSSALNHIGITLYYLGKFQEAHQYLEKSLDLSLRGGVRVEIWANLIGVAGLSGKVWLKTGQKGLLEQAARLCGAISTLMNSKGQVEGQPFRKYFDQALEVAWAGLNEVAFKEAFARGQAMSLEEANIYAGQALAEIRLKENYSDAYPDSQGSGLPTHNTED